MANKPLTQRIIDTTPLPKTGFKELRERGLVLRIYATGGKSWSFEYRSPLTGKNARITFEATCRLPTRARSFTAIVSRLPKAKTRTTNERTRSLRSALRMHARSRCAPLSISTSRRFWRTLRSSKHRGAIACTVCGASSRRSWIGPSPRFRSPKCSPSSMMSGRTAGRSPPTAHMPKFAPGLGSLNCCAHAPDNVL